MESQKSKTETRIITSSKDMEDLGIELGKRTSQGCIFLLFGEMGSGKTTFVHGLAEGLGITGNISSPTYIIMRGYTLLKETQSHFYHVDLYRLENNEEMKDIGLFDILHDTSSVSAIEWAEKLETLPDKRVELHFSYVDENTRKVEIKKYE